jgi:hypothetical protein
MNDIKTNIMSVVYKGKQISVKEKNGLLSLDLSHRGIKRISEIEGLAELTDLQVLSLKKNEIEKIEYLDTLKSLVKLDLSYNKITTIEGLRNLTKLEDLNLEFNDIKVIEGLDNLKELMKLTLFQNIHLSEIKSFQNKENLVKLVFSGPLKSMIKRNYRKVTLDSVLKYAQLHPEELIRNREIHLKAEKRKSTIIRICLISIGSIFILWGILWVLRENCSFLTSMGGLAVIGVFWLGLYVLVPGIIYPYSKRVKDFCCYYIFLGTIGCALLSYLLGYLIISLIC